MKCVTSCATYDAWLVSNDWQAQNPCYTCEHEQETASPKGTELGNE